MEKDLKTRWTEHLAEAKRKEGRLSQPEVRNSIEAKKHYRKIGLALFILGLAFTLSNVISAIHVDRFLTLSVTAMIFFIPFGLWLMVVGKLPKWFINFNTYLKKRRRP
jgi:hypothetical protein